MLEIIHKEIHSIRNKWKRRWDKKLISKTNILRDKLNITSISVSGADLYLLWKYLWN